jgi:hypothetical protein
LALASNGAELKPARRRVRNIPESLTTKRSSSGVELSPVFNESSRNIGLNPGAVCRDAGDEAEQPAHTRRDVVMARATIAALPSTLGHSHERQAPRLGKAFAELRNIFKGLFDPYRPELHYMRGPGPKWHAKHDGIGPTAH